MVPVLNVFHELRVVNMKTNIFENITEFIVLIAFTAKEIMIGDMFDPHIPFKLWHDIHRHLGQVSGFAS
jgi:hypothetical protein